MMNGRIYFILPSIAAGERGSADKNHERPYGRNSNTEEEEAHFFIKIAKTVNVFDEKSHDKIFLRKFSTSRFHSAKLRRHFDMGIRSFT